MCVETIYICANPNRQVPFWTRCPEYWEGHPCRKGYRYIRAGKNRPESRSGFITGSERTLGERGLDSGGSSLEEHSVNGEGYDADDETDGDDYDHNHKTKVKKRSTVLAVPTHRVGRAQTVDVSARNKAGDESNASDEDKGEDDDADNHVEVGRALAVPIRRAGPVRTISVKSFKWLERRRGRYFGKLSSPLRES